MVSSDLYKSAKNFWRLLIPDGGTTERAVKSGVWAMGINIIDRILHLGKLIILSHFLSPADFGLLGIALLTRGALRQLSNFRIDAALIQREETNVDGYLNTAWSMQIIRGVGLVLVMFFIAPYISQLMNEPRATDVIRVISVISLILGLRNPGILYLTKNLEFHKQFLYQIGSTATNVTTAIILGFIYQSVWALVVGALLGATVKLGLSYIIQDYRPQVDFNSEMARELLGYGKWMAVESIAVFSVANGDDAFVGWFLGASALGLYQIAYRFSDAPARELSQVISSVAFPTYSKIQNQSKQLQQGVFKTITLTTSVSFPAAIGILAVTPQFIHTFFDDRWLPVIVPMQILAVFGMTRSVRATTSALYRAVGHPNYDALLDIFHFLIIAIFIYPAAVRSGLIGTSIVVSASVLLVVALDLYVAANVMSVSYISVVNQFKFPLIASIGMGIVVLSSGTLLPKEGLWVFLLLSLIGVFSYSLFILGFERRWGFGLSEVITTIKQSFN
ncbi:lipopolysaccharide biosynthesis protein [Haloferax prahovense]|uniref:lipopolysaccharide biosynthesis protein n=1 Tax=Haloferax prahovense TaxID=381852 RepID=UPI003C74F914